MMFERGEHVQMNIPGGFIAKFVEYVGDGFCLVNVVPQNELQVVEVRELVSGWEGREV